MDTKGGRKNWDLGELNHKASVKYAYGLTGLLTVRLSVEMKISGIELKCQSRKFVAGR